MSSLYTDILSSLRATELAIVAVDALILPNTPTRTPPSLDTSENWHDRRVLTVVSHKDEWALAEEGAIFVYRPSSSNSSAIKLELQSIYPIYGKFSIEMSQLRKNTLDLSVANAKAALNQPRSGFSLNITPAMGLSKNEVTPAFYATDVQSLGVLVAECKRLKETTEIESPDTVNVSQTDSHFSWLRPYISRPGYLPLLLTVSRVVSSIPPDLREANKPLLERLSTAMAGTPGDDAVDIRLIRDEWIMKKVRSLVRLGKRKLSIRLGTFNVNGKMPSQDLSSWIQGTTASPLSHDATPLSLPPTRTPSPENAQPSSNGNLHLNSSTMATNSTTTLTVETGSPVSNLEPDIFALGFQELDLSTEALIYSTGTAREDAWCLAIFAALGEKAIHYEKLASKQLVGMLIVIVVKKALRNYFGDVQVSSAGSGILGLMGNKGATAVRLTFMPPIDVDEGLGAPSSDNKQSEDEPSNDENETGVLTLTFINAHLAAFDEMVDRRNQDFHEISRRLTFPRIVDGVELTPYEDDYNPQEGAPTTINIYETDVLFWLDLNYRVDISDAEFRQLLVEKDWNDKLQVLIRYDQLKKSMSNGKAFKGFTEHPITYFPSYRFASGLGTDHPGYDQK
ncbi:Inositol polyphosphate 5-phosphatase OCRL-1 [Leucoagaricus sp. SymC.cos]|nr:Inositol polyphosphate 5-phosphatase OCRL-1 [Leucoagaricus sp. SymC.cos]